jgi:hypothetical protein
MAELERDLRQLPVDWPPTPDLAARLELAPRRLHRRRLAVAALVAAAVGAAFAVPQSRSAILRFFHLGGVTVERVGTLPPAAERPLASGLGSPVGGAEAARVLGADFLPRSHGPLYERGGFVSTLLATPEPVLLSEFGSAEMIKKLATSAVEPVEVAPGVPGLWLSGARHAVFFPGTAPRLAGNVLVWASGGVTYRLEGRGLDRSRALRVAREVLGTSPG